MSENSRPTNLSAARWWQATVAALILGGVAVLSFNVWVARALVREQRAEARERAFWVLCQPGYTPTERETAFRALVAAGNHEWRSAEIGGLNFAGLALPGADLRFARFYRTNLTGADLTGANLAGGSLELADLSNARLSNASLVETRLFQTVVRGAVARSADLRAGMLGQLEAQNSDFSVANLSDAELLMANFSGAKLIGANLSGAKMQSANFKGANLSLARLDGADITDADFTNANWWSARGLTSKQLTYLKKKFSPTADADQALKDDFARWSAVPVPSQ